MHTRHDNEEGNGNPLQYSCLENSKDWGAWWASVHGVAKSQWATSLSLFTVMHWRRKWQPTPVFLPGESPRTEEPGRLQSMGSWSQTQLKRLSMHTTHVLFAPKIWEAVTYSIAKWRYRGQFSLCFFFFAQWQRKCCSEKEKRRGMRLFSFPFLITKNIKRTVSRPEHS